MASPTQLSTRNLEGRGYLVEKVERWIPYAKIRKDLFGFADLIAVQKGRRPILVQSTGGENESARVKKVCSVAAARVCLLGGFDIEVHGWNLRRSEQRNMDGKRSKRSEIRLRVIPITVEMLEEHEEAVGEVGGGQGQGGEAGAAGEARCGGG